MNIEEYMENQDFLVTCFNMRYGGGFTVGIFSNITEQDRLIHASSYEYEQGEFRDLFLTPGVLPFAHAETMAEATKKLEAIIDKVTVQNRNEYYSLWDTVMEGFPVDRVNDPLDLNYCKFEEAVKAVLKFKEKWKF